MSSAAACGPIPAGTLSVPAIVLPSIGLVYETSRDSYGKGAWGVCGRLGAAGASPSAVRSMVSGYSAPWATAAASVNSMRASV